MSGNTLSHIKVIDLSQGIDGPYCTKLMAGFGADVVKIEPPNIGDETRQIGPLYRNEKGLKQSIPFLWLNTGKRSVTLDFEVEEGKNIFKKMIKNADVLIGNFPPGNMKQFGMEYETLREINPKLIMASITNFGQDGHYKDYIAEEIQIQAMCGLMHMTGESDKEPLASGPSICRYTAGLHAYFAVLSALYQRMHTGRGQYIDISCMESGLELVENALTQYLHAGIQVGRNPHVYAPWGTYPCKDGYAVVVCAPFRRWAKGVEIFEESRLLSEEFRHVRDRSKNRAEIDDLIQPWLSHKDKKAVFLMGQEKKLGFGFLADFKEVFEFPQHKERGFFIEVDHPEVGKSQYCGAPYKMTRSVWENERAPLLGEHNVSNYIQPVNGYDKKLKTTPAKKNNPDKKQPLEGLRVIDLTHAWSGPHCTRVLADLGAEVIRIEYLKRLDIFRGGKTDHFNYNRQPPWHQVNRNKRSITLDLNESKDREIFEELVKVSDVLVENSRIGVMDRLGYGYENLTEYNPDLVMISISAFGATGQYASYCGYGATFEAVSGIQNLTAYNENEKPQRIREMDVVNGIGAAGAILTALIHRQKTGEGQYIDFSQTEFPTHALIGEQLLEYAMSGKQARPLGNRSNRYAPQGCYRCNGEDKWIVITIRTDENWKHLCSIMGRPDLAAEERFASFKDRMKHHDKLDALIEEWTKKYTHYEAVHVLQTHGIPAAAVLNGSEIAADPHLNSRAYFVKNVSDSDKAFMGFPFKMSDGVTKVNWKGPDLGRDNEYVICRLLGCSKKDVKPIDNNEIGTAYDPD